MHLVPFSGLKTGFLSVTNEGKGKVFKKVYAIIKNNLFKNFCLDDFKRMVLDNC